MVTRTLFTLLVLGVALQRILEVRYSERNVRALRAAGGREHAEWQIPLFKCLHASWMISAVAEVWLLAPVFRIWLAVVALVGFAIGQTLRLMAIRTLGPRWAIRVITLPAAPPVVSGIYRYLRHPNYVGVAVEIAALPLVHGAIYTAVVFSALNALLLRARIAAEERALDNDNHYLDHFGTRPRFVPARPPTRDAP